MITRSYRKAVIFCECNSTRDDLIVCVRVIVDGKRTTYNCTPSQALNHMFFNQFVWFDIKPHI